MGNANITGYIQESEDMPASNWKISGNIFKKLKRVAILPPGVIDNSSKGVFEFSSNVI